MSERKESLADLYPSSQSAVCGWCGAFANFHGKPEDINKAAAEFYRIHGEAHQKSRAELDKEKSQ